MPHAASPPPPHGATIAWRIVGAGVRAVTIVTVVLLAAVAAVFGAVVAGAAVAAAALRARPEGRRAPKGWVAEA